MDWPILNQLSVLIVGNNPIDLTRTFESLKKIRNHEVKLEVAFDFTSLFERLTHFHPNFILVDDNLGRNELHATVEALRANKKTKNIPITILKNSNYQETVNSGVMNYVLKNSLTGESLHTAFINSVKFMKTQLSLQQSYQRRKGQLLRMIQS